MAGFIDELVPPNAGAALLRLELRRADAVLRAFTPIEIVVTVTGDAKTNGVSLPLELTMMGPNKRLFRRKRYDRIVPTIITVTPQEGGLHLIRLAEMHHQHWWGSLYLQIAGEKSV
ncbi:MAG TPA: hypothetical protein PKA58_37560 [Polyangium sp.]|nr:hypothetical protein [Polyangium sp.]